MGVLADRLFSLAGLIVAVAGLLLVLLTVLRVRYNTEVEELTRRDSGNYWKSLPWEKRSRYLRRFAVVSWAFTVIILSTLIFGAWVAYWGWGRPGH